MIRKSFIALAAIATLSAAALAPTSASAWGFNHHHHFWGGYGPWGFVNVAPVVDCYFAKVPGGYVKICD